MECSPTTRWWKRGASETYPAPAWRTLTCPTIASVAMGTLHRAFQPLVGRASRTHGVQMAIGPMTNLPLQFASAQRGETIRTHGAKAAIGPMTNLPHHCLHCDWHPPPRIQTCSSACGQGWTSRTHGTRGAIGSLTSLPHPFACTKRGENSRTHGIWTATGPMTNPPSLCQLALPTH